MYDPDAGGDFTISACVCQAGFGANEQGACRRCKPGTYSPGGTLDACMSCGADWTSEEGAVSWQECFQEYDAEELAQAQKLKAKVNIQSADDTKKPVKAVVTAPASANASVTASTQKIARKSQ